MSKLQVIQAADPKDPEARVKVRDIETGRTFWLIPLDKDGLKCVLKEIH